MNRILTIVRRYVLIHLRSPARLLDIFFWPVMELFVWGFFAVYLKGQNLDATGRLMVTLLNALVFWDILYRSQQSLSLAFMEELWTRNVLNLLISPLRIKEWVIGAYIYGVIKTGIIVIILLFLAALCYAFNVFSLGFYFVPLALNLLLFGFATGLFTTGLLLRWGHAAEALIWGVPFLIQPFSAIFYPVSVYPAWLKPLVLLLPSTHVFEAMRSVIDHGVFPWSSLWAAVGLNIVVTFLFGWFCLRMLERGRKNGQLVRMAG
ncbi:MAG: ABC transporter permease [Elusimicrobia bacterium]|jgi:ABC-2 type transport system permease protein|nr:ABC transporter permease [Elusimicrobiota bacterium]